MMSREGLEAKVQKLIGEGAGNDAPLDDLMALLVAEMRAHEVEGAARGLITYAEAIEQSTDPLAVVRLDAVAVQLRKSAHRIRQDHADTVALAAMVDGQSSDSRTTTGENHG